MFEKEAEEFKKQIQQEYLHLGKNGAYPPLWERIGELWGSGAEFGYNKANEWHYVKDGDLPKDEDWKWCIFYRGYCYVAKYEEMFGCWTNQEHSEVMQPYAWKEIVLPNIKESE